jgi:hypothetical protein
MVLVVEAGCLHLKKAELVVTIAGTGLKGAVTSLHCMVVEGLATFANTARTKIKGAWDQRSQTPPALQGGGGVCGICQYR